MIRRLSPALGLAALLCLPLPLAAQESLPAPEDGPDMIERGIGSLFQDLMRDLGPHLGQIGDGMSGALSDLAPLLQDLAVLVDDLGNYQMPQRLENGDIVIRRNEGAPPPPPIGESLRGPDSPEQAGPPIDPNQPQISL